MTANDPATDPGADPAASSAGPELLAYVDGRLVPASRATVSAFDRGFRSGEGVFETLRAYGDHPFRLDAHLERAAAGAAELGFDPPARASLAAAVRTLVAANLPRVGGADTAVRLTISAGVVDPSSPLPGTPVGEPTVVATSHHLGPGALAPLPARAVTVPLVRELAHVKSVSYVVALTARRRAREAGADEALLVGSDGEVREAATSNVFVVHGTTLVTPPTDAGLLAGVTRQVLLEVAGGAGFSVEQRRLELAELHAADEALLTASTRGVIPLVEVDERPIGGGVPGPATSRLRAAYLAEIERERSATGEVTDG